MPNKGETNNKDSKCSHTVATKRRQIGRWRRSVDTALSHTSEYMYRHRAIDRSTSWNAYVLRYCTRNSDAYFVAYVKIAAQPAVSYDNVTESARHGGDGTQ